jgi:flagellar FliL protein
MATAKPPAKNAAPAAAEETVAPKKKSRLFLIIGLVVLLLAAVGGGAAWFFLRAPAPAPGAAPGTPGADAKHTDTKPPVFVTLEPFTVNLQQENGDHYLQAGIVIQVTDAKAVDAMKTYMPVIRNRILLLLSSKTPSDISSLDGKKKLVAELVAAARESVPGATPERGIDSAFLSSFVIQ